MSDHKLDFNAVNASLCSGIAPLLFSYNKTMKRLKRKCWATGSLIVLLIAALVMRAFGRAITVMSDTRLNGMTIVIDAGHGGKDPGARSQAIDEDEINLKTAKKLQRLLEGAGTEVIMIREEDVDLAPSDAKNVKREDLKKRVEIMNQPQVTLFISIHCNISLDKRVHGAEVYYQQGNENSHQLAAAVLERLRPVTQSKFQPKTGNIYILKQTTTLGILAEIGFLSNSQDLAALQKDEHLDEIAYAIFQGIDDFVKILE